MIHVDRNEHQCTVEGKGDEIMHELALAIATTAASISKATDEPMDKVLDGVVKIAGKEARAVVIKFSKERK